MAMIFPGYVLVKYLAYSIWAYLGLRWLRGRTSPSAGVAFGSVRLGLGLIFGVGIFVIGGMLHLNALANSWLAYFAVYVPVRYVEGSILAALLGTKGGQVFRITDPATQRWILGGIVVSHLADLPLILYGGEGPGVFLPVGRFLC
jgi:hypothetical protein